MPLVARPEIYPSPGATASPQSTLMNPDRPNPAQRQPQEGVPQRARLIRPKHVSPFRWRLWHSGGGMLPGSTGNPLLREHCGSPYVLRSIASRQVSRLKRRQPS
jgi:hypothetical protein